MPGNSRLGVDESTPNALSTACRSCEKISSNSRSRRLQGKSFSEALHARCCMRQFYSSGGGAARERGVIWYQLPRRVCSLLSLCPDLYQYSACPSLIIVRVVIGTIFDVRETSNSFVACRRPGISRTSKVDLLMTVLPKTPLRSKQMASVHKQQN